MDMFAIGNVSLAMAGQTWSSFECFMTNFTLDYNNFINYCVRLRKLSVKISAQAFGCRGRKICLATTLTTPCWFPLVSWRFGFATISSIVFEFWFALLGPLFPWSADIIACNSAQCIAVSCVPLDCLPFPVFGNRRLQNWHSSIGKKFLDFIIKL